MSTLAFPDRAPSAAPALAAPVLRRACACGGTPGPTGECEACRKKRLQRSASSAGPAVAPPIVHHVLRGPGRPLDAGTRAEMEPRFRHSFADVRVHADAQAAQSARAVGAQAYTVGRDVVFGAGRYAPASAEGRRLMAHELAHVVQQRGAAASLQPRLEIGAVDDPAEREAERTADAVMRGASASALGTGGAPALRRLGEPERDDRMDALDEPADAWHGRGPAPEDLGSPEGMFFARFGMSLRGRRVPLRDRFSADVLAQTPGQLGAGLRVFGEGAGPTLTTAPLDDLGDTWNLPATERGVYGRRHGAAPRLYPLTPPAGLVPVPRVPEGPSPPPATRPCLPPVALGALGLSLPPSSEECVPPPGPSPFRGVRF